LVQVRLSGLYGDGHFREEAPFAADTSATGFVWMSLKGSEFKGGGKVSNIKDMTMVHIHQGNTRHITRL
jgi:hypothetical protein